MWGGPNYFFFKGGGDVSHRKYIVATPMIIDIQQPDLQDFSSLLKWYHIKDTKKTVSNTNLNTFITPHSGVCDFLMRCQISMATR